MPKIYPSSLQTKYVTLCHAATKYKNFANVVCSCPSPKGTRNVLDKFIADYGMALWIGLYHFSPSSGCADAACNGVLEWGDGVKLAFNLNNHGKVKANVGEECFRGASTYAIH